MVYIRNNSGRIVTAILIAILVCVIIWVGWQVLVAATTLLKTDNVETAAQLKATIQSLRAAPAAGGEATSVPIPSSTPIPVKYTTVPPTATNTPTSVPPTATATTIPPIATQVSCATKDVFLGDNPANITGANATNFGDKNMYGASEVLFVPANCPGSTATMLFNDWETGKAAFAQDVALNLNPNQMYNLQKYTLPNGKLYSDKGQKVVFGPGCLTFWQNDVDMPGGVDSGWKVVISNNAQCGSTSVAPQPVPAKMLCNGAGMGFFLGDNPSKIPGIQMTNFHADNLYGASQVRLTAINECGKDALAAVLFQDWEPVGNGKDWKQAGSDFTLNLKVGQDVNLQKVFFPNTATWLSDHGQRAVVPAGTCLELWENDDDFPGGRSTGWYGKFCNSDP